MTIVRTYHDSINNTKLSWNIESDGSCHNLKVNNAPATGVWSIDVQPGIDKDFFYIRQVRKGTPTIVEYFQRELCGENILKTYIIH